MAHRDANLVTLGFVVLFVKDHCLQLLVGLTKNIERGKWRVFYKVVTLKIIKVLCFVVFFVVFGIFGTFW